MLQHWRLLLCKPSPLIRCLIGRLPRGGAVLEVVVRIDAVRRLRRSELGVLRLRLSVLLAEQAKSPVGDVEAAEDDDGEEDLLLRWWSAKLRRG